MKQSHRIITVTLFCLLMLIPAAMPISHTAEAAPLMRTPTAQAEGVAPLIVATMPEAGQEQLLDAPIEIRFDQPMNRDSVERAFAIEPGATVDGTFEWPDDQTMRFSLNDGFARGERYRIRLVDTAMSEAGLPLARPFELRFSTVGTLEVTTVQPSDGSTEIAPDSRVTVVFNRPVVPLNAIEEARTLPDPLIFTPSVDGQGEWLNTSIYQFSPTDGFLPATEYTARLRAGLTDATDQAELVEDIVWNFTTVSPAVVGSVPRNSDIYVSPTAAISLTFNQPMNRESVEANFVLRLKNKDDDVKSTDDDKVVVAGEFSWTESALSLPQQTDGDGYYDYEYEDGDGPTDVGVETVRFVPHEPLILGQRYQIDLPRGASGAVSDEAQTQADFEASFTVVPLPQIESIFPADGSEGVSPWENFQVRFNAPMNPDSLVLGENIFISPTISATEVYSYWWRNNTRFELNFPTTASAEYEVVLGPDLESRSGEVIDGVEVVRWQTAAHDPTVYLHSPGRVSLYAAYTDTIAYVSARNLSQLDFELYRMDADDFIKVVDNWSAWNDYVANQDDLLAQWSKMITPPLNATAIYGIDLAQQLEQERLSPGLYFFQVMPSKEAVYPEANFDYDPSPEGKIIAVSDYNLTVKSSSSEVLAWLTDLESGQPVSDIMVRAVMGDYDGNLTPLGQATTDEDGVALIEHDRQEDAYDTRYVLSGNALTGENFAISTSNWDSGISRWEFNNVNTQDYQQPYAAEIYTERRIYRPDQTVYFKAILRADDDAHYSLPTAQKSASLVVYDPLGKEIFSDELPVSENGTMHGQLTLAEQAPLGSYSIDISYDSFTVSESFQVTAYRKPEYLVEALTDKTEYVQGDTVTVVAEAQFFAGGPVSNAEVRWTLLSDDYGFRYQGDGFYDFTDYDSSRQGGGDYYYGVGEVIAEGTGTTDDEGRFMVEVEADIADKLSSQKFTLDVTIQDINDQLVATQASAVVHKGLIYVGLQPEEYIGRADEENRVNVLAVDWDSQPLDEVAVQVVFAEHNWYSVQQQYDDGSFYWDSVVEDVPVFTTTVTTVADDSAPAQAAFTPEKGGIYKVIATATDSAGNEVRSSTYMWVSGSNYVNWRQENNDRLELVTDKKAYNVGDTATILIPHPYDGPVQALITLERGQLYEYMVQELPTNSEQIEIPITEAMIPNMYVSVVLVDGAAEFAPYVDEESGETVGLPSFKIGYASLPITNDEKQLTISLTPNKGDDQSYQPQEDVFFDVAVTNHAGEPVQAELSLAMVDKAVLSLAPETPGQLLSTFWSNRGLGVRTGAGLTLAIDRINLAVAPQAKGGGGGIEASFGDIRGDFRETALWLADLTTDEDGLGEVELTLPDNLTTWTLTGKAVTGADTLVGEGQVEIISTKPLLVRPVAPRFMVVGDEARMGLIVQNNSDESQLVETVFKAVGGIVEPLEDNAVTLEAGERVRVEYLVLIDSLPEDGFLNLSMGAKSGDFNDALTFDIPVYPSSTPETVATSGVMSEDGLRTEAVSLPSSFDPTQGELTVNVDHSLAAGMRDGLDYLTHFRYECTEQTVSRFLPNVFTYRAYEQLNLENPALAEQLPDLVSVGLQRLYNQQHTDGGWGWFVRDDSNPFLTAYVLLGLVEAQRADFAVEQQVIDEAVAYLKAGLTPSLDVEQAWQANRQAFMMYVLAEAGSGDLGRAKVLFRQRAQLDYFGRAYLAMTMHLLDEEAPEIDTLLNELTDGAIVSATGAHWEESQVDYYAMNTDTRSTAIIIAALSRIQPEHPLLPQAVRWLMTIREHGGHWETTQETAWAIIGLTDWMVVTGELDGDYAWAVYLNGDSLGEGQVAADNVDQTSRLQVEVGQLLADTVNQLAFERTVAPDTADSPPSVPPSGEGSQGKLYYAAYLEYFKPVEEIRPVDRGIIVSRQYRLAPESSLEDAESQSQPSGLISEAAIGDTIEVKLTIVAPNDLHYVLVEDPLPAGTEGIDTSLATTSVVGQQPSLDRTDRNHPWGWWYFSHSELRDDKAVLFATYLPKGTYEYTYYVRASVAGEYRIRPTHAEQMYFPEVFGRGEGGVFTVVR